MYEHIYIHVYIYLYMHMYIFICILMLYIYMHIYVYEHVYVMHIYIYEDVYVYMHSYMYIHVHICVCTHMYEYWMQRFPDIYRACMADGRTGRPDPQDMQDEYICNCRWVSLQAHPPYTHSHPHVRQNRTSSFVSSSKFFSSTLVDGIVLPRYPFYPCAPVCVFHCMRFAWERVRWVRIRLHVLV